MRNFKVYLKLEIKTFIPTIFKFLRNKYDDFLRHQPLARSMHGNKTHMCAYPLEPNLFWWVFPILTGFGYGFEFTLVLKHGYWTGNGDIGTHPETIPKLFTNVKKSIYYHFYIIETQTLNHFTHLIRVSIFHMTVTYHSSLFSPSIFCTLGLFLLLHHSHQSATSLCWIMHYTIGLGVKTYFYFN